MLKVEDMKLNPPYVEWDVLNYSKKTKNRPLVFISYPKSQHFGRKLGGRGQVSKNVSLVHIHVLLMVHG